MALTKLRVTVQAWSDKGYRELQASVFGIRGCTTLRLKLVVKRHFVDCPFQSCGLVFVQDNLWAGFLPSKLSLTAISTYRTLARQLANRRYTATAASKKHPYSLQRCWLLADG